MQLFSDGHLELILESCADYWNGETLVPMDETVYFLFFHFSRFQLSMDKYF